MFGIGYQEMFIVLVVAMIVFGPSRLPELAGQVGRWVRELRRMSSDLTGEFEQTFAEVEEVKKSFKRELSGIQDELDSVGKSTRGDLKKSASKTPASGKKPAALKAGTRFGASKAGAAKSVTATSTTGKNGKATAEPALVVATKAEPLVDVSFFDVDFVAVRSNGVSANGKANVVVDDAVSRVRRRRAAAEYSRRISA